jgi:hypothetical protein
MARYMTAALATALLVGAAWAGGEASAKKPVGDFARKAGDNSVTFHFKAHSLKVKLASQGARLEIEADFGVSRDGHLFGRVSKVEAQGVDNPPPVGHLFSFRYAFADDGGLTISELKGTDSDEARQLVQGDYKKVKGQK